VASLIILRNWGYNTISKEHVDGISELPIVQGVNYKTFIGAKLENGERKDAILQGILNLINRKIEFVCFARLSFESCVHQIGCILSEKTDYGYFTNDSGEFMGGGW
jgi:hypothetical protein